MRIEQSLHLATQFIVVTARSVEKLSPGLGGVVFDSFEKDRARRFAIGVHGGEESGPQNPATILNRNNVRKKRQK